MPDKIYPDKTYRSQYTGQKVPGQNILDNIYREKYTGQHIPEKMYWTKYAIENIPGIF